MIFTLEVHTCFGEVSGHSQKKFLHDRHKASHRTSLFVIINIAHNAVRPIIAEEENFKTAPMVPSMRNESVYRDARNGRFPAKSRITD